MEILPFKKLQSILRELGWANSFWYLLKKALENIVEGAVMDKYYFIAQPTARSKNLNLDAKKSSTQIREIFPDEDIVAIFPRPSVVIERRFAQGAHCYGAFSGQKLQAFIWFQPFEYFEDEVRFHYTWLPREQGIWSFDVYVYPEYRFGLTFVILWQEMERRLREQGILWAVSRISAFNVKSLASHKRLGWHYCGECVFIIIRNYQISISNIKPYIHLSKHKDHYPDINIKLPI